MFKKLPDYCAPSVPVAKVLKNTCKKNRRTQEFENVAPYLAIAKFRIKRFIKIFGNVSFIFL